MLAHSRKPRGEGDGMERETLGLEDPGEDDISHSMFYITNLVGISIDKTTMY